ncbi:MAG: DNA translocase FtsK 4TM domain-containing protein, partial [Dehalococcoidia bacterium]
PLLLKRRISWPNKMRLPRLSNRRKDVFALLLMVVSLFVFLSLITYDPREEPTISPHVAISNMMGILGVYVSHYLIKFTLGYVAILFPLLGLLWGVWLLFKRERGPLWRLTWYALLLAVLTAIAVGLPQAPLVYEGRGDFTPGGLVGGVAAKTLHDFLGPVGTTLVVVVGYFLVLRGYFQWDVRGFLERVSLRIGLWYAEWRDRRRRAKIEVRHRAYAQPLKKRRLRPSPPESAEQPTAPLAQGVVKSDVATAGRESSLRPLAKQPKTAADVEAIAIETQHTVVEGDIDTMEERRARWRDYKLPPLELLVKPPPTEETESREDLLAKARELERALETFKVQGTVVRISPGPIITLFEVEPGEGVRVNKFVTLADDLARVMSAKRIRVIAPISGTKHVGVEIPNRRPATVYLRSIITSDAYVNSRSPLTIALGKTTAGDAFVFDLARMPHLLIAGTTGSGKSVCINSVITSLLYRAKPHEVKFILIDPKKLELSSYQMLEGYHLITTPGIGEYVMTTAGSAVAALRAALQEMERRYDLFSQVTVRNIEEYQAKAAQDLDMEIIPHIIIIIDELSDLMLMAPRDVEEPITRLAQMSRAVGIHLVIATQRPSVDVITGLIKANFPARIAFQVASKVDSRTILDQMGAEKLLGRGDLLFPAPGTSEPRRLHAAYISLEEIVDILDFVQKQPQPGEIFLPEEPLESSDEEIQIAGETDELFAEATRLVIAHQQASVSLLQRRFRIGYSRAGRLIDELEQAGIVSGYSGSKAREVLVDESYLEQLERRRSGT